MDFYFTSFYFHVVLLWVDSGYDVPSVVTLAIHLSTGSHLK